MIQGVDTRLCFNTWKYTRHASGNEAKSYILELALDALNTLHDAIGISQRKETLLMAIKPFLWVLTMTF